MAIQEVLDESDDETLRFKQTMSDHFDLDSYILALHTTLERVQALGVMSLVDPRVNQNPTCVDRLGADVENDASLIRTIMVLSSVSNAPVFSCSNVSHLCTGRYSYTVRALCSHTCRCDSPYGGLFFGNFEQGCPVHCSRSTNHIRQMIGMSMSSEPLSACSDISAEQLRNNPGWMRYWETYRETFNDTNARRIYDLAINEGCNVTWKGDGDWCNIAMKTGVNLGMSLAPFCPGPTSCRCAGIPSSVCPPSCMR